MNLMTRPTIACVWLAAAVAAAGCSTTPPVANAPGTTVLYEGARLIPGDGSAAIEDAAFLVENDTIARIGRASCRERVCSTV